MSVLLTGSAIRGLPVVTIAGGEDVAEVRDVIYSPEAGRVVGLTLNKRGFLAGRCREVLSAETIHAIGRDAVMIDDETSLILPENSPADLGTPPSGRDVTGNEVLTEAGQASAKYATSSSSSEATERSSAMRSTRPPAGSGTSRGPTNWPCRATRSSSPTPRRSSSKTTWSG